MCLRWEAKASCSTVRILVAPAVPAHLGLVGTISGSQFIPDFGPACRPRGKDVDPDAADSYG